MEEWHEKKCQLESDLENVKRMVENSLDDCEERYDVQFQQLKKQKLADYADLKQRCKHLQDAQKRQESDNQDAIRKTERLHYDDVKNIEEGFEEKLEVQL